MSPTDAERNVNELPVYALDLIERVAKQQGFAEYTITQEPASKHGDGFQGVMVLIVIEGSRQQVNKMSNQNSPERLTLICKMPPMSEARRKQFNTSVVFKKEVYVYDRLLPSISRFQRDKGITTANGFFEFPKCYGTFANEETGDYAIVMEDLRESGYKMWNKFQPLDYVHAKLAMSELGKFHALSFALRDQRPKLFTEFRQLHATTVQNMLDNDLSQNFLIHNFELAMETLQSDEMDLRSKMQLLKETFWVKMHECTEINAAEPFGVVNHGDFWNNNIMYQYGNGSLPKTACFIDWQITQFCSPAMDIVYFLFTSTEQQLRDEHYDDLIVVYYQSLADMLTRLGSDSDILFTFADLQDQLKRFARYGLIIAPMLIQFVIAEPSSIPDLNELTENIADKQVNEFKGFVEGSNPVYQKRMSTLIRDFFRRGYNL